MHLLVKGILIDTVYVVLLDDKWLKESWLRTFCKTETCYSGHVLIRRRGKPRVTRLECRHTSDFDHKFPVLLGERSAWSGPRHDQTGKYVHTRFGPELNSTRTGSVTDPSTCLSLLEVGFLILRRYCGHSSLIGPHTLLEPCTAAVRRSHFLLHPSRPIVSHVPRKLNDFVKEEFKPPSSRIYRLRSTDRNKTLWDSEVYLKLNVLELFHLPTLMHNSLFINNMYVTLLSSTCFEH